MCIFGDGGAAKRAADEARAAEAARQARIASGTQRIGEVFGKFDDAYFDNVQKTALDYYNPEAQRQYEDTRKGLTFSLARGGKLASTSGADALRKLADAKARADVDIAGRSSDYANQVRGNVERSRSDVTSQLYASGDPEGSYSAAVTQAALAGKTPAFQPLGDLFSSFLALGANAVAAERAGYRGANTGLFTNRGSARVVT